MSPLSRERITNPSTCNATALTSPYFSEASSSASSSKKLTRTEALLALRSPIGKRRKSSMLNTTLSQTRNQAEEHQALYTYADCQIFSHTSPPEPIANENMLYAYSMDDFERMMCSMQTQTVRQSEDDIQKRIDTFLVNMEAMADKFGEGLCTLVPMLQNMVEKETRWDFTPPLEKDKMLAVHLPSTTIHDLIMLQRRYWNDIDRCARELDSPHWVGRPLISETQEHTLRELIMPELIRQRFILELSSVNFSVHTLRVVLYSLESMRVACRVMGDSMCAGLYARLGPCVDDLLVAMGQFLLQCKTFLVDLYNTLVLMPYRHIPAKFRPKYPPQLHKQLQRQQWISPAPTAVHVTVPIKKPPLPRTIRGNPRPPLLAPSAGITVGGGGGGET